MRSHSSIAGAVIALALTPILSAQSTNWKVISNIDLSKPFSSREDWHFIATQGPPVADTASGLGEEPGQIQICLRASPAAPCDPQLLNTLRITAYANDSFSQPHYLNAVKIVYPRGSTDPPILFVQTASMYSGDGGQVVLTQALAYQNSRNRFVRIYRYTSGGRNENEEVRYISSGRLKGDIISVDPTENAPYGYWVTVNALTPQYTYEKVLRYRSATHYGDRNPLAVIDSEMPNIERHLGYWKPGMPLPIPSCGCPRPRLIRMELWCK